MELKEFCNNLALVNEKFAYTALFWDELEKIVDV